MVKLILALVSVCVRTLLDGVVLHAISASVIPHMVAPLLPMDTTPLDVTVASVWALHCQRVDHNELHATLETTAENVHWSRQTVLVV
jgi:hypothetical protein